MITETLLNSLKSLFSSLGAKTSDSNYAVGLFDKTNGEPKGMMGMSDLASVLGVVVSNNMKIYTRFSISEVWEGYGDIVLSIEGYNPGSSTINAGVEIAFMCGSANFAIRQKINSDSWSGWKKWE